MKRWWTGWTGKHLNLDVPSFAHGTNPATCEAIAAWPCSPHRRPPASGRSLERVRIMEDPTLYADCTGLD